MTRIKTDSITVPIRDINTKYTDLDLSLSVHPLTGKYKPITGNKAIMRSIKHLVMMSMWDVPFKPEIHGGLDDALFEQATPVFISSFQNQIADTINENEPRVSVIDVDVNIINEHTLVVNIQFEIIATEEVHNTSISIKRER